MRTISIHPLSALAGIATLGLLSMAQGTRTPIRLASLTPQQQEMLGHMSIVYLDDGQGGTTKTIRLTGVNLQIVNGLGATNGNPIDPLSATTTAVNGVGNLIVGYNELQGVGDFRTGSHTIVTGQQNDYVSFGGLLAGWNNGISGSYSR